ncbi:MAG TPA: hypothetical protein VEW67_05905 [Thermoleophilaceae bacterium]|nr:hypothetical protein [Thermoleophilaceae bacterium]
MNDSDRNPFSAELREVEHRLSGNRPELTTLELDAIKRRAMTSATRTHQSLFSRQKGFLMKSRLAVTMMLALGLLMSGTGATLAVSGISSSGSAASVQYPDQKPAADVLDEGDTGTPAATPAVEVQPTRQVSTTGGDTLPFTGFLAIPVLLGGVALLTTGAVLRRRSGKDDNARA